MIFKDYYKILGLESTRVSINEIKIAYRAVAKKYHPDVNIGDTLAEERIKDINEAYRILVNPQTKKKYDRIWNSNVHKKKRAFSESDRQAGSIFSDFFYMFFGNIEEKEIKDNKKLIPRKGENIETSINIDVSEAFFGIEKQICIKETNGKVKKYNVKVPAGIRNGEKIRLIGQGKLGENGGNNGDLFIKIKIKNNGKFIIKGQDLYTDLPLTPWEATLGTKAIISSIDEEVTIYIPAGIQTGEKIRIPGKGYKKGKEERGDLVAEIKIMVPKKLTKEEKFIFEKLNEISSFNPRNSYKGAKNNIKKVDKVSTI